MLSRCLFVAEFGPISSIKINKKGCYGFIQYQKHEDAVAAIVSMHGVTMGDKVRVMLFSRHVPNNSMYIMT